MAMDFSAQNTELYNFFWGTEVIIRLLRRPLNNLIQRQEQNTPVLVLKKIYITLDTG